MARIEGPSAAVVVGATSGIGRATALMLAEPGVRLVIAARDRDALDEVALTCRERGATVTPVPTDIADPAAVDHLRDVAAETLGTVDAWVNAASLLITGRLGSEDPAEIRRVVDVNVTGTILASRAAMELFRGQRHGSLVNVASLLGVVPNPLAPVYCASKFAIRGVSMCLRHEARALPGVHVSTVLPGPVDTPMFEEAANHTGRRLRAIPPAMSPERVAAKVVACTRRPRREATIGASGTLIWLAHRVAPATTSWMVAEASARLLVRGQPDDDSAGNLDAPSERRRVDGGWRRGRLRARTGDAVGRWLGRRALTASR